MFKLIKHLKQFTFSILAIVALLVVQAVCDLSLPDYTSKIVNVGIQQGGIEQATPDVIRKAEMEKLSLFISESDYKKVLDSYTLLEVGNALKSQYNVLEKEPLYQLNTKDKSKIEELNNIFAKPMLLVGGLESGAKELKPFEDNLKAQLPPQMKQATLSTLDILANLPKQQLTPLVDKINAMFQDMPDSIIRQSAVAFTKKEYTAIGINTERLQSNFILLAGLKMIGIALLSMAATVLVGYLGARVAAKLGMNLRQGVFRKVVSFSNAELDKFSTASLITRSTNDIQQIQMLMVMLLRIVFYAPILGIGGVIKVLNTNTSMAWIIAVAVMAILSLVLVLFGVAMPRFKKLQSLIDRLNLVTREILTGIPVIRAFSTQKHEEQRFDKANRDLTKTNLFVNRIMTFMMPAMMFIMNSIAILIVWKGAQGIDTGAMQVGDMMAFIQYTMQIIMSFLMISMISIMLPRASVSAARIDEVLKTNSSIIDPETPQETKLDHKGYVEFKDVSFHYPDALEDVLSNISFVAKPGETTAFIGSTGSGKSTLINLIPRFYDVTKGEILLDGVDIRNVTLHDLREKIGYVPQKSVLFSGTIESNIKYGAYDTSDDVMKKAAEIAQATEFIESKSEQYNSEISQGGTNVSGGQKQRLSIARAIAKQPEVYIFDDSFSALDYKTDVALRKALKSNTANSTVLIVAQRISTILHADQIIVLDEGQIIGKGTHKELLKSCDVYKQIAQSQLSKEELEHE
ncbi:ABC transporter ATP-binding protein [Paludicola sp. MB14-C6]|uniref:ABC transporter ATP-binding protein n=1 Tax=Paludihabitans sp. MB14-C6 TaxID=3070656 RepID=UPI0027DAD4C0|nr:ABC transporter ATP-binding protein [Paludicola sp. MB14-C6]WMJ22005.1 ABC transporter ATP-binding protein [Paludicola sp. MB14-C6]